MQRFFTVIGGMGTAATESYVRLLNKRSDAKKDQDYMDYILVNHASVPDRTSYILDHSKPSFYPALLDDIRQQSLLNPDFMVIVCNTAHYFYDQLQAETDVPLLHMPRLAIQTMCDQYPDEQRIGLIATEGTIADGIYTNEIESTGREVVLGDRHVQDMVNELIYTNIKENNRVDGPLFHKILQTMHDDFKVNVIVLGCTELSLAQELAGDHPYTTIDAQSIIVDKTLALGRAFRESEATGKAMLNKMMK
ncbi:aspartate/glutamate racemase family protein [Lacticaseibacillus saniviri]|uniref:Aspartate racemase n=1 Tax=Lacticaseibacillus saniviri JCM 17471 = DSM 24301 TaxID=1293598 RepID=A0A0R2MU54_9LACO|nr:amino acid racemase [Lacticaseibacillus saniviri]KRO16380.1 aspartate racemase [Lacticaseibacillus saniviri JCM 17471 = DSM 24301]MCG4280906.1 amino acid racemase [Lacticaseibacillus saniviri]